MIQPSKPLFDLIPPCYTFPQRPHHPTIFPLFSVLFFHSSRSSLVSEHDMRIVLHLILYTRAQEAQTPWARETHTLHAPKIRALHARETCAHLKSVTLWVINPCVRSTLSCYKHFGNQRGVNWKKPPPAGYWVIWFPIEELRRHIGIPNRVEHKSYKRNPVNSIYLQFFDYKNNKKTPKLSLC